MKLLIFRYHLIPIKLARFPEAFGLKIDGIEGKQFFPYLWNREKYYDRVLPHLPAKIYYCADSMMKKVRDKFDEWWTANYHTPFDLREVLADYCRSDVRLLAHGFVEMRNIFFKATRMDITRSITASV